NFSACMTWLAGPLPPSHEGIGAQRDLLACVARATTCEAARACLIFELIASDDARCTTPTTTYCLDGETVLDCAEGYVWHCGVGKYTPGATCATDTDGTATCAIHEPSGTCTTAAGCTGTYADYCDGTMRFRYDCATLGVP